MNDKSTAQTQGEGTTEAPAPVRADPFAGLKTIKLNEAEVLDLSGVGFSPARKYDKVHTAAIGAKMPVLPGWKYGAALFVPGSTTKEFRAGSVFGTIVDIVKRSGKAGIASYELATELRRAVAANNKRSHYCSAVPPVGWAEGYINSAVQQGLISQHASRKAPALVAAAAAAEGAKETGQSTGTNG